MYLLSIFIISTIFAIQPFIKKRAIKNFTIDEYYLYTQIIGFILISLKYLFFGLNLTNLKSNTLSNYSLLLCSSLTTFIYSNLLNNLLKKYKVQDVIPYIKCGEMILIYFITIYNNFDTMKIKQLFGIILVISGIYINNM